MKSGKLWFSDEVMLQFEPATCRSTEMKSGQGRSADLPVYFSGTDPLIKEEDHQAGMVLFHFVANQALFLGRVGRLQRRLFTRPVARCAVGLRGYAAVQSIRRNRGNFFA